MSKMVKELIVKDFQRRLDGVSDALLVDVIGVDANSSVELRRVLREKDIQILVLRNSLAKRAIEGTTLEPALAEAKGTLAFCWGSEDFVSLAKEITAMVDGGQYKGFEARGGVLDGERLTAEKVKEISKWPNREEQLSLLLGQILGPGAELSAALLGPGSTLASQIKEKAGDEDAS